MSVTTATHPASCKDPDNCTLTYAEHLKGFGISALATPTRGINKTPGQPDEPLSQAVIREKRWERDIDAFKRLHADGLTPPRVDGSALRERSAETAYDVTEREVKIDYSDPT